MPYSSSQRGAFYLAKLIYLLIFALIIYVGVEYARSVWITAQAQKIVRENFLTNRERTDEEFQAAFVDALKSSLNLEVLPESVQVLRSASTDKVLIVVPLRHWIGLKGTRLGFGIPQEFKVEESVKDSNPFKQ